MSLSNSRKLKYSLAINEALSLAMRDNEKVTLIGQGVKSPWYVGSTCRGLIEEFSERRVIDTPVSENAVTGAAVGASIVGNPTVVIHPRVDFMMYAIDPIVNQAANWNYMSGGASNVPVVIWGIVNRGGEQAAQHSQSLHAMFAHIPGLKVVMPSNARDAKGLMLAAIEDPNPVVFIDDRSLYGIEDEVPEGIYRTPIGKANVAKEGKDLTIVSSSFSTKLALDAAQELEKDNINLEVVDLRTISPIDKETIIKSVQKTKRLLALDGGWSSFGVSSETVSIVSTDSLARDLISQPRKLALADVPAPASSTLEDAYYLTSEKIIKEVKSILFS